MNPINPRISRRDLLGSGVAAALYAAGGRWSIAAEKKPAFAEELFAKPKLLDIKLKLSPKDTASLRKDPRIWVEAMATVDGQEFPRMGVHLKGTTSFMPLDRKPSFTLSTDHFVKGRRLIGLHKIHLNNSVQDTTFLCEDLAGELFHRAGVPRARSAWATVRLDDRDLGLYVLKEGFTNDFLAMNFGQTNGNFYDGGLHHDVFQPLKLESGDGPRDWSDLKALHAASQLPDLSARWQTMQKLIEMDRFISMMALESLTCHIDGYSMMQNNFRIYFDPASGKAVFIVHGMDRMFKKTDDPLEPKLHAVLSKAVMSVPEGKALYRARLSELVEKVFQQEWMTARIDTAIRLLEPASPPMAISARALRERIIARVAFAKKGVAEFGIKA